MNNRVIIIFLLLFTFSCTTTNKNLTDNSVEIENITENAPIIDQPEKITLTKEEIDKKRIDDLIETLSIEEKIGQLFMFQIRGFTKMDNSLKDFITKYKPGGIILFSNNIVNDKQIKELTTDLQSISNIPLFISVDEEGGVVSRLGKEKNVSVTHLPPALEIGNKNNPILAYNSGKIIGSEIFSLGFNMDMAPVADVNTNPKNPVIGNRTYSANQHIAGEMVVNFIKGLEEEHVIGVMKHFPGHGDTTTDTHVGVTVSPHNRERLDQIEFVPFVRGIKAGANVIMTAHMNMPGLTSVPLPATLNPEIITGVLRNDLGFNGVIISDAMDMGAITNNFSTKEATILALKAGIDIILIPNNQPVAFQELFNSYKNGDITEERINTSLYRILNLKLKTGVLDNKVATIDISDLKTNEKHIELLNSLKVK